MTYAGSQIQENLHVPTCYPGIVYIRGEAFKPDPKKWGGVDLAGGKLEYCRTLAVQDRKDFEDKGKVWEPFYPEMLDTLEPDATLKFTHCLAGISCSGARPMVSAKCEYNNAKALAGRIFRMPKENPWGRGPHLGVWEHARVFKQILLPTEMFRCPEMPFEDWLASMPSHRRRALQNAAERLARRGWNKSCETFKAFVKSELLPGFAKSDGELVRLMVMLDRLIQGPADETHVIAGKYLKPKVKQLKKVWDYDFPIFYGSNSPEKLHKWLNETLLDGASVYFWCDFSMFDNTHSNASWDFIEEMYWESGITDPLFWKVMECWRRPKGKIGAFKYQARTMNASGRDDTALANGLLNGFATYLSCCAAWLQKDLLELTVEEVQSCYNVIKLSVCGDDSLGRIPLVDDARVTDFRARMAVNISMFGFEAKLNTSVKLYDAVYLGMRPYPTEKGWFWGKTIGRSTYKMGWVRLDKKRDVMAHITGVADMHVQCSSHVPILSDLAERIVALRTGAKRTPVQLDENRPWEWTQKSGVQYDALTLQAVAETYTMNSTAGNPTQMQESHVTVNDVLDLIGAIRRIERLPCVLDHWLWKHMVVCDDL